MTYVKLDEINQTVIYPPVNKGNICNYDKDFEALAKEGYADYDQALIDMLMQGKAKIIGNTIRDITDTPEYIAKQLVEAKANKLGELRAALEQKLSSSTITMHLPALLALGEQRRQVTSYKLKCNTSGGAISVVILGLLALPLTQLPDLLVTDEGWTIVGLKEEIEYQGKMISQISAIYLAYLAVQSAITAETRRLTEVINAAATVEECNSIIIDFSKF